MAERITDKYSPDHPNANIHGMVTNSGMPTCVMSEADSTRCSACCTLLGIEAPHPLERNEAAIWYKSIGIPCEFLNKDNSNPGCSIYEKRPHNCVRYHCSKSSPDLRARLIIQGVFD